MTTTTAKIQEMNARARGRTLDAMAWRLGLRRSGWREWRWWPRWTPWGDRVFRARIRAAFIWYVTRDICRDAVTHVIH